MIDESTDFGAQSPALGSASHDLELATLGGEADLHAGGRRCGGRYRHGIDAHHRACGSCACPRGRGTLAPLTCCLADEMAQVPAKTLVTDLLLCPRGGLSHVRRRWVSRRLLLLGDT